MRSHRRYLGLVRCAAGALGLLSLSSPAVAHKNGIAALGCEACHGSALTSAIALAADPPTFAPGTSVTFTATITRTGATVGGLFVPDPGLGQLAAVTSEGLSLGNAGLTHSAPKPAANGVVTFRFAWRAPAEPGAVHLGVFGLGANGDGTSNGDAPGEGVFSWTFGCTSQTFYFDADGDGYGAEQFPSTVDCAGPAPVGYSARKDDCDDAHDTVHPGATELCNGRDDNCDGTVDEGAVPATLWPDPDGDGYYGTQSGTAVTGCLPLAGYAGERGDCAPNDSARHPGAIEICNLLDDNCDGRVDEGLRPQCGVGLCRRQSSTCNVADCVPGVPVAEICNLLDDDCNGDIDDGAPCSAGSVCVGGKCVADVPAPGADAATTGGGSTTGAGGSTTGAGGSTTGSDGAPGGGGGAPSDAATSETGPAASTSGSATGKTGSARAAEAPDANGGCSTAGKSARNRHAEGWVWASVAILIVGSRVRQHRRFHFYRLFPPGNEP